MSTTENALTAHLLIPDKKMDDEFLKNIFRELHDKFGIEHPTIQLERIQHFLIANLNLFDDSVVMIIERKGTFNFGSFSYVTCNFDIPLYRKYSLFHT